MAKKTKTAPPPPNPSPAEIRAQMELERRQRNTAVTVAVLAVLIIISLIALAVYFLMQPATETAKIRDIFIIFLALESIIIGGAFVILIIQVASLINLVNNEIKPILKATNETIDTLKHTSELISESLVAPVTKLNEYVSSFQGLLELAGLKSKKKK